MSEKQPDTKKQRGAKIYRGEKERSKAMGAKQMEEMEMREMAARNTRHHLQPMPMTNPPEVEPFPAPVMRGLGAGILGGILIGIFWAALQLEGLIAVPGWEGLFSMTPVTFYTFWAVMGAALFGMLAGIAAIIATPAES